MSDVSKTTVLILLILTVLVSVMGVFTVFQAAVFAPAQQPAIEDGNNRATISFEIKEPEITESEDAATISFEVLPQNEIGG